MSDFQIYCFIFLDILRGYDNLLALSRQEVEEIICELRPLDRDFNKDIGPLKRLIRHERF